MQKFSSEERASLKAHPFPRHVAIIMDGNRRWAKKNLLSIAFQQDAILDGHWAGAAGLMDIVEAAIDLGISVLTLFAFSTENWEREPDEVAILLHILQTYLESQRRKMVQNGVRFHTIGDLTPFSSELRATLQVVSLETQSGRAIDLVVALNYGGRDEMRRVMQRIAEEVAAGRLASDKINETTISGYLDTAPFGDPDLLIRTSGEKRLSNFLLWQLAYAELYLTETLWPDFGPKHLLAAVQAFQKRERRLGK